MNPSKQKRAGLYLRVSTSDQRIDAQKAELTEYASRRGWAIQIFADEGISGAKTQRPALDQLMSDCRKRKIDVVVVWKFDRFARSLKQLVSALEEFRSLGIDFISVTESVDTSIPTGELVFQIFGAIAQFERSLISARVRAGLNQAKREGKRLGRRPLKEISEVEARNIAAFHAAGNQSVCSTARAHGITEFIVRKILRSKDAAN